jgi:sterol desaturase/sphingolipid hydroxylase (fatty acid hydroxylase superfamily)
VNKIVFFTVLVILLYLVEIFFPLRKRGLTKKLFVHGLVNILIIGLGTILVKGINLLIAFYAIDVFSNSNSLVSYLGVNGLTASIVTIILFDFLIWLQHLLSHHIPLFWRFHRVHHCDRFLDTTSGLRFHPIEIAASMLLKLVLIYFIGINKQDFLIFEMILTGFALFNHSNIKLPDSLDKLLSYFIVTPNVHQVHHSTKPHETNSNFGFNIVIWDRVFGTYTDYFKVVENLEIGLEGVSSDKANSLSFLLLWPLSRK